MREATGADLILATVAAFSGLPSPVAVTTARGAAIRFVVPAGSGRLRGVDGVARACAVPGVVDVEIYREPGAEITVSGDFRDRIGHALARGATAAEAAVAAEEAVGHLTPSLVVRQGCRHDGLRPPAQRRVPEIRRMLLERRDPPRPAWKAELDRITHVDLAHVVMLAERRIVGAGTASTLLAAITELREQDYRALETVPAPRGLYLAYESHLIDILGDETGGVLQTGRSRNDLGVTCLQLALREPYRRLSEELSELGRVLLERAHEHREVLMPAYTHFQAAVPVTYGHYLLGLAQAFERDARALAQAGELLERCPLGAGSIGGTTVPINPGRTANLLGFGEPVRNSVDAIATRDTALRLLSTAVVLGVTLDRAALDLLMWSSAEFGLVTIPDGLVGSSSMMPQKRNAFVLEHVQGSRPPPSAG